MNRDVGNLSPNFDAFAVAFVTNGGNATNAAIAAGYSPISARQQAYKLTRNPTVQRLIREEQQRLISGRLCTQALGVLETIMLDPKAPAGARVDACKTILDRGGLPAIPANLIIRDDRIDHPLADMTLEQLNQFIADGTARLAALDACRLALPAI